MDPDELASAAYPHSRIVDPPRAEMRLDRFLRDEFPGAGRAAVARLIAAGGVLVNGRRFPKGGALRIGDRVSLCTEPGPVIALPDPDVALEVLHEDPHCVVASKAAGQPSHPLRAGELGTLAGGLLARYPEMAEVGYHQREPGLVHRLDTGTSGLLLAARDPATFEALRRQLRAGAIRKQYLAVCAGSVAAPATLRGHLLATGSTVRLADTPGPGTRAITLQVLDGWQAVLPDTSTVRVSAPLAARHQIRAQMAWAGHPLVGDLPYGGAAHAGLEHHLLHAECLTFTHPQDGSVVALSSPPPSEFVRFAGTPIS